MSEIMPRVQARVREVMAKKSITVADLAGRTGRSHSDVRRSLVEPHWWRLDRLLGYAEALGESVSALLPAGLSRSSPLSGTPEREVNRTPLARMAAAEAAGRAVAELNQIGAAGRRRAR
jgi:hypothetical protein